MAHSSTLTGGVSESVAAALLMSKGFSVFTALAPETYDLICVGTDGNGDKEICKVQVKTVKIRNDREGQLVIRCGNMRGVTYSKLDVDYILGVHGTRGWLVENREVGEYWSQSFEADSEKWTELRLEDDSYDKD